MPQFLNAPSRWRNHLVLLFAAPFLVPVLFTSPTLAQTAKRTFDDEQAHLTTLRSGRRAEFQVATAASAIRVDAVLDEEAWTSAAVIPLPFETNPGDNEPAPVETYCLVTFDQANLYFACEALDPDPDQIRAYITDRDDVDGHDRVSLIVDPFNDARRAFNFTVNALGVQLDGIMSSGQANGDGGGDNQNFDPSWDAIWHSKGRLTDTGYIVEAAIPFKSLRFPSADGLQTWGFYAQRWWPRSERVQTLSMYWDRGNSCQLCQANLLTGLTGITPGRNLEFTPTLTSGRTDRRDDFPSGSFDNGPLNTDLGLDARWSITTDLALNATLNPDFSQVEADVAQLDINNRFALFFPEKRPFFLEGADFFNTPLQAAFTRTIADPSFGTKVSGKLGANAVGALVARDEVNNLLFPGNQSSATTSLDEGVTSLIGRFRRDIGTSSTVGALYTGREGNGYHNRVGGVDGFFRPFGPVTAQVQYLYSATDYDDAVALENDQKTSGFGGHAVRAVLQYNTRNWMGTINVRSLSPGFRADAGFITQVDVRGVNTWFERRFWSNGRPWFTSGGFAGGAWHWENFDGRLTDQGMWFNMFYNGPRQSFIWINPSVRREYFDGVIHDLAVLWSGVGLRPSGALGVEIIGNYGSAIDFANARKAIKAELRPAVDVRMGRRIDLRLSHTLQRFSTEGSKIFLANVSQVRAVYNFTPRTFVRSIVQFRHTSRASSRYTGDVDRLSKSIFTQLLFSYKVNPQTAIFLGYSDNREGFTDLQFNRIPLTQADRTVFLKLSYALRP